MADQTDKAAADKAAADKVATEAAAAPKPAAKPPAQAKAVFRGPNGARFVPAPTLSPRTIAARVKAGTWTPENAAAKTLATKAREDAAKLKATAKSSKA